MSDYTKIYIYTTGKNKNKIVFRDVTIPMQLQHPIPAYPVGNITQDNIELLFDMTKFGTAANILASATFQEGLVHDWWRAFNEFGIELDNYTSKLSPDETYADGEVPAWSSSLNKYVPTSNSSGIPPTQLIRKLTVTAPFIANEIINITTGLGANSGVAAFSGVDLTFPITDTAFNSDGRVLIFLNGILQEKGTGLEIVWDSPTSFHFTEALEIGEKIQIFTPIGY